MKSEIIIKNIHKCIYSIVPHFMINSKENHVEEILVSIDSSEKIKIYPSIWILKKQKKYKVKFNLI